MKNILHFQEINNKNYSTPPSREKFSENKIAEMWNM